MGVLTIERLDATLGARITGVRRAELDDSTWPVVAAAFDEHAVACQPPRICHHDWQVGDLVVWDNRGVLHLARSWSLDQLRVMKHTRVSGDPITEGVAA